MKAQLPRDLTPQPVASDAHLQEEADLAVALFQVLREELLEAVKKQELKKPVVVGVISPYREQVTCIQETLRFVLGQELAKEARPVQTLPPSLRFLPPQPCSVKLHLLQGFLQM